MFYKEIQMESKLKINFISKNRNNVLRNSTIKNQTNISKL